MMDQENGRPVRVTATLLQGVGSGSLGHKEVRGVAAARPLVVTTTPVGPDTEIATEIELESAVEMPRTSERKVQIADLPESNAMPPSACHRWRAATSAILAASPLSYHNSTSSSSSSEHQVDITGWPESSTVVPATNRRRHATTQAYIVAATSDSYSMVSEPEEQAMNEDITSRHHSFAHLNIMDKPDPDALPPAAHRDWIGAIHQAADLKIERVSDSLTPLRPHAGQATVVCKVSLASLRTVSIIPAPTNLSSLISLDESTAPPPTLPCPHKGFCESPRSPMIGAFPAAQPVINMLRKSITPTRHHWMQVEKRGGFKGLSPRLGAAGQWWGRVCDTLQQRLGCFAAAPHTLDQGFY